MLPSYTTNIPCTTFSTTGENKLEQIIHREDLALVLFTDESNQALNHLLKRVLNELEDSFGIATVEVSDLKGKKELEYK